MEALEVSHFRRISPAMAMIAIGLWCMSKGFAWQVMSAGASPIPPEMYGDIVYAIPALTWAYAQEAVMLTAAVSAGLPTMAELADQDNPAPWPVAVRVAAGSSAIAWLFVIGLFGFFAYGASGAPKGSLLLWGVIGLLIPVTYFFAASARHAIRGEENA
jgi:hypothetical protein